MNRSILADARTIHGGDIIIHSHYGLKDKIKKKLTRLQQAENIIVSKSHEFYSVVQTLQKDSTLLCKIKIVDDNYPLYGKAILQSNRHFANVLTAGKVIVEQNLLDRLQLHIGDQLHIGNTLLKIADVITHEPDRPVNFFSFGPRVFLSAKDLDKVDLVKKGSRVQHSTLLKIADTGKVKQIAKKLILSAHPEQERVETFKTARSRVKKFFNNLLFFLSLISIFTLILAGLGMQSSLGALLRERQTSIAVIKSIGASNGFLLLHYFIIVIILGFIGSLAGICFSTFIKQLFPSLFASFVPNGTIVSTLDIFEGLFTGLSAVVFFTFIPLHQINLISPGAIFRDELKHTKQIYSTILFRSLGLLLLTLLTIRQLEDVKTGFIFTFGCVGFITLISLLSQGVLLLCKRITLVHLPLRLAIKSLLRPGNATNSIITTLASAIAVLLTIYLLEQNLHQTYVDSYPDDAPNVYFLDIQPDQKDGLSQLLDDKPFFYPIIRARLASINNTPINRQKELSRRQDNLLREFNLTQRNTLLSDELLLDGEEIFQKNWPNNGPVQVSVLDTAADMGITMGDFIQFNIQGVVLDTKVTSIRTRNRSKFYPYFYYVFPENTFDNAPKTFFAAMQIDTLAIASTQNKIVATFPNISVLNMSETLADIGVLLKKLSKIINFFAFFSLLAGALIIISSIFATRLNRIQEAVYYKISGCTSSFITHTLLFENIILGMFSALLGVVIAQVGSWTLCHYYFEISYTMHLPATFFVITGCTLMVTAIGLFISTNIIRHKPAEYLREQNS